jgi:hypothetical protein
MGMDSLIDVASRNAWLELAAADCSVPVPLLIERHRITANSIAASTHHIHVFSSFRSGRGVAFAGKNRTEAQVCTKFQTQKQIRGATPSA